MPLNKSHGLPGYEKRRIQDHFIDILASRSTSGYDQNQSIVRTMLDALTTDNFQDPYLHEKSEILRKVSGEKRRRNQHV